jgi:CSLREA domain-containing protein
MKSIQHSKQVPEIVGQPHRGTLRRSVERWLTTAMLLAAGWAPANAATIVVNTLADPGSPGVCALRDAITAANTDAAVNDCSAGSGADTITFGVAGTITISIGAPPRIGFTTA